MIYIAVLAGIFIACGFVGAWIVYQLTDVQGDICDMCGAESWRRDGTLDSVQRPGVVFP